MCVPLRSVLGGISGAIWIATSVDAGALAQVVINDAPIGEKQALFGIAPLGMIPTAAPGEPQPVFWQSLLTQTDGLMNGTTNFPYLLPLRSTTPSSPSMQTYAILDAPYTRPNLYQLADGYGTALGKAYQSVAKWSNPTEPYSYRGTEKWSQISRNVTDVIWFAGQRLRDANLFARGVMGSGSADKKDYSNNLETYNVQRAVMARAYIPEAVATRQPVVFRSSDPNGRVFKVGASGDLAKSVLISEIRAIGKSGDPNNPSTDPQSPNPVLFEVGKTNSRPFEVFSLRPELGSVPTFYARNYNTDADCTTTTCLNYNSNWAYMMEPPDDAEKASSKNVGDVFGGYGIDGQVNSSSYASGHAIYGWYGGLVMGMMLPERFQQMNTRGAENGLGRAIGGWHWPTDVIASRTLSYYGVAQMMAGEEGYYGEAGRCPTPGNPSLSRCLPSGGPYGSSGSDGSSGVSVTVTQSGAGSFRALLAAARADMAKTLSQACGASIAACAANDSSRFANKEVNKRFYEATLTMGLPRVWSEDELSGYVLDFNNFVPAASYLTWRNSNSSNQTDAVTEARYARNAGYLLETRFPYLTLDQRNEVLTTTIVPDSEGRGTFLDNGSAFGAYSRINLFKASDGYGSFRTTVDVTMNAADGGFSAADTWSNDISGSGGLIKRGTGILTLAGHNTFTGPITLEGGGLNITGSVSDSGGLIANAGVVAGTGNLPATTINAGATHAPGNSIGTQTVNGNYALNNATLAIELQGPTNDRVNVTGTVTAFSGTAQLVPYGGGNPWPGFNYTVVQASNAFTGPASLTLDTSGVTSALLRFGSQVQQNVDNNPSTFDLRWQPTASAGATTAAMQVLGNTSSQTLSTAGILDRSMQQLQVAANGNANAGGAAIGTSGFTQNQAAAAGLSANYIQALSGLIGLNSGAALSKAVNAIAPQPYAAFLSVGLDTLRQQRSNLLAQAGQCYATGWVINPSKAGKTTAASSKRTPLCVYAQAGNTTGSINGTQGLDSYNSGIFSTGLGLETSLSKQWMLGLAFGYGTSYANNFSGLNASVNANVNGVSIYSVYRPNQRWSISSLLGYSNFTISGSRTIPGLGGSSLAGSTSANGVTAALEASYFVPLTLPTAATQVLAKPVLGLAWGGYQQTAFNETGGGFSQAVQGRTANSLLGTIGVEFTTSPLALNAEGSASIVPRLALAYQVDALANNPQNKTINSSFVGAPAAGTLSTEGQNLGVSNLNVAGGFTVQLANQVSLYASASYLLLSNANQFAYNGGVRVKF